MKIGAAPHERSPSGTTRRNGVRPKTLATPAGEVDLQIPKLREGVVLPVVAAPASPGRQSPLRGHLPGLDRRSLDQEGRPAGPCARQRHRHLEVDRVADLRGDRRGGAGVPAPPDRSHLVPYLFLDATYLDVRHRGAWPPPSLVVATGVSGDGRREILGMAPGDAETTDPSDRVPPLPPRPGTQGRHRRRPARVTLVTEDAHAGLESRGQSDPARIRVVKMPGPFRSQRHPEDRLGLAPSPSTH